MSAYSEFKNSKNPIFDKKSIYENLLNKIKNAELNKKEENILDLSVLKELKKCLKKYNKITSNIYDLLKSSENISILSQMDNFTKSGKNFLQEKCNIDRIISNVNKLDRDSHANHELISNLVSLKK